MSPHAFAALVIAAVGVTQSVVRITSPFGLNSPFYLISEFGRQIFIPVAAGSLALWLCVHARREIFASEGVLFGDGWIVAARVLAVVAIVMCVVTTVVSWLLVSPMREGVFSVVP